MGVGTGVERGGLAAALGGVLDLPGLGAGVAPAVAEGGVETVGTPHPASPAATAPAAMARSIARRVIAASFVTRQR